MSTLFQRIQYIRQFIIFAAIMLLAIFIILAIFAWKIYSTEYNNITNQLREAGERIEFAFNDTIEHTEYIMQLIITQIVPKHEDLAYIHNVLGKYRTNQNISNILSWTVFSWVNANHLIIVDGVYGVLDKPKDISDRDYVGKIVAEPFKIVLGQTVVSSTSKKKMIPAGIGVLDQNNQYIGAITIGFDIENLTRKLESVVGNDNINFILLNQNHDQVLKSYYNNHNPFTSSLRKIKSQLEHLIKAGMFANNDFKETGDIDLFTDGYNYYYYKFSKFPYILYMSYDNSIIRGALWKAVMSRLVEVIIIGISALALLCFIYKRETNLRKQAEAAREIALKASQAKSDFLAFTAHELRTPLGFIVTSAEIMKSQLFGQLSDKYLEYSKHIHQAGLDVLEFIDDLLDKSQVERGNFKVENQILAFEVLINKVVKQNIAKAKKHHIELKVSIQEKLPKLIADSRRLVQILNNLLSNSIKYSPENTVINIMAYIENEKMHIAVIDQGFGIAKEDLEIAFAEYGVIHNQNSAHVKSIGLGLPLVKSLTDAHGAQLIIDSKVGEGTKVTIVFPATRLYNEDAE